MKVDFTSSIAFHKKTNYTGTFEKHSKINDQDKVATMPYIYDKKRQ